jgi:hypothetical protein
MKTLGFGLKPSRLIIARPPGELPITSIEPFSINGTRSTRRIQQNGGDAKRLGERRPFAGCAACARRPFPWEPLSEPCWSVMSGSGGRTGGWFPRGGPSGWRPTRSGMTGPGVQAGLLPSSGLNTTEPVISFGCFNRSAAARCCWAPHTFKAL